MFLKCKMTPTRCILVVIIILSFALRILEVYPGQPFLSPDEPIIKDSAIRIGLSFNFKPTDYYYGQLLPIIYGFMYIIFFIPLLFVKFFITHIEFFVDHGLLFSLDFFKKNVLLASDPTNYFHYAARYSTAIISSLTVIPLYLLGKRLFSKEVGLIASFLLAVNYRHLISSNIVLADAPAAFFATSSVLLSVVLLKKKSLRAYIFAGIGMALSLSVKYFVYVIPVFFLCHILGFAAKKISLKNKIKKIIFNKNLFISLITCLIIFLAINPYLILDNQTAKFEFALNSSRYGLFSYNPTLFNLTRGYVSLIPIYYLFWKGIGPLISVAILAGFLYGFLRFRKSVLIIFSTVIPFMFVFICIFSDPPFRNFAAIIPFLMLFPGIIIADSGYRVKKKVYSTILIVAITLVISYSSIEKSIMTTFNYMKPHNEKEFGKWIDANIPKDKVGSFYATQVLRDEGILEIDRDYFIQKRSSISSLSDMIERNIKFAVISSYKTSIYNYSTWVKTRLVEKSFFDEKLFWARIGDTYYSLLLQELNDYKIKEFLKPFGFSTDRAIFIVKIPDFWKGIEDRKVKSYTFESLRDQKDFSFDPLILINISFIDSVGYGNTKGLLIDTSRCNSGFKISSNKFLVIENRRYTLVGLVKHNGLFSGNENGFLRLDFYSKDNLKLKTYVSGLANASHDWQRLVAAGVAPKSSAFAAVTLQADNCFSNEGIIFDNLDIYLSDSVFSIDKKEYPFYEKPIPKNFLWSNEN